MSSKTGNGGDTRQAILQAAGQVFADRGYRATTVREICDKAGANIAAVNYHFGDKQRLYMEVIRLALRESDQKYPYSLGLPSPSTPVQRLHNFVRVMLMRVFDKGAASWSDKLVLIEMIEPTGAMDLMVDESFRPMANVLAEIITGLAGKPVPVVLVQQMGCSIVSQCVFYLHCRSVVCRLFPEQTYDLSAVESLAQHITEFTLGGIARTLGHEISGSYPSPASQHPRRGGTPSPYPTVGSGSPQPSVPNHPKAQASRPRKSVGPRKPRSVAVDS